MTKGVLITLLMGVVVLNGVALADSGVWLQSSQYDDVTVVLPDKPGTDMARLAQEFQHYWKACTGYEPEVSAMPGAAVNVWIGADRLPAALASEVDVTGLGRDGLLIRTLSNGDLVIAGETTEGTSNGVYEFFERFMGVRWLTTEATYTPAAGDAIAAINYRYIPPFEFRWSNNFYGSFGEACQAFARVHRFRSPVGSSFGLGHNTLRILPPPEYFHDHPEFYGLDDKGKREALWEPEQYNALWEDKELERMRQICMSNPDVAAAITQRFRERMPNEPNVDFWGIFQEDLDNWCLCDRCAAIDAREETPMGSMLTGINRVAEAIEKEFPDKQLMTYAYSYTRHPPKHMKPRDNISFLLCTIECDFLRPFEAGGKKENKSFVRDLKNWARLTDNLLVYDYAPNFAAWMRPHPNFGVIVPNLRMYAENGVMGVFVQGDPQGAGGMVPLRGYLIAQGLWNPSIDHEAVRHEFMNLYYGSAAPFMEAYVDLATKTALDRDVYMGCFDDGSWLDYEFVRAAVDLMNQAMAAADTDTTRHRVRQEWLRLQYAGLTAKAKVTRQGQQYILERAAEIDSAEFLDWAQKLNVRQLDEQYGRSNVPLKQSVEEHLGPLGRLKPRDTYQIVTLQNDRYLVEVVPELAGAIVRFEEKKPGFDVFRAAEAVANGRWTLQEWNTLNDDQPTREAPLISAYRIVEQSDRRLVLETQLKSGVTLRRTMELEAGDGSLTLEWDIQNNTEKPAAPFFKVHPEFWTRNFKAPELWLAKKGEWHEHPLKAANREGFFGGEEMDPETMDQWAARIARKRYLVMDVDAQGLENTFYFFNTRNEHLNLELIPDQSPLQPGETRHIETKLDIVKRLTN